MDAVRSAEEVRSEEAWCACASCVHLVEVNDRQALLGRGMRRYRPGTDLRAAEAMARHAQHQFWMSRPRRAAL